MRRIVALATLIALAATLLVPLAAFAKGGPPAGKGPGSVPPGQAKKAAAAVEQRAEPAEEAPAMGEKEARKAAKEAAKAEKSAAKTEEKAEKSAAKAERKSGAAAAAASVDESDTPSVDESATLEPEAPAKLTGIANALSRIMANIERAEAKVAAGQKLQVPPGLLKVMAKFLGWLGIETEPGPDTDEPGLADPGLTDPGEGSVEDTPTPIPDSGSKEDSVTIEPDLEE